MRKLKWVAEAVSLAEPSAPFATIFISARGLVDYRKPGSKVGSVYMLEFRGRIEDIVAFWAVQFYFFYGLL